MRSRDVIKAIEAIEAEGWYLLRVSDSHHHF